MILQASRLVQVALLGLSVFTFMASVAYLYGHNTTFQVTPWLLKYQQPKTNMTELYINLADRVQTEVQAALTEHEKFIKQQLEQTEKSLQKQQQAQFEAQKKKEEEEKKKKEEEEKKHKEEEKKKKEEEEKKKKEEEKKKKEEEEINKLHDKLQMEYHYDEVLRENKLLEPYKFSNDDYTNGTLEPSGNKIVIITACDSSFNQTMLEQVLKNRDEYARFHGYEHVYIDSGVYAVEGDKGNWNKVPAIREVYKKYKDAEWLWWLDTDAFIMNETVGLAEHLLHPKVLAERLTYDRPIMNVDYKFVTRYPSRDKIDINNVDIVLTHDNMAWNTGSVFFRRSEWTEKFLDIWDTRDLRGANFRQVEQSAMTHLMLKNEDFLPHFGQVPQRLINAYHREHWEFVRGDLILHFAGTAKKNPEFYRLWQQYYDSRIRVPKEHQLEPDFSRLAKEKTEKEDGK